MFLLPRHRHLIFTFISTSALRSSGSSQAMTTTSTSQQGVYLSHIERTAKEPRDEGLHTVILSRVEQVNDRIRLLRLSVPEGRPGIKFLAGQWLDVHVPGIHKPGGFTITSPPSVASALTSSSISPPFLELAIQASPTNPPAAWLWQPIPKILNKELQVRVGGSFVWPPPGVNLVGVKRVVFVAGGVGINPLMAILSHLAELEDLPFDIQFLYTLRHPGKAGVGDILFLERLRSIFGGGKVKGRLLLYLTPGGEKAGMSGKLDGEDLAYQGRRVTKEDILEVLGPLEERRVTVCYICGVPTMTDEFVKVAQEVDGMDPQHVLFERWW